MPYILVFAGIAAGFFALQTILSSRAKSPLVKGIPAGLLAAGLLVCLVIYLAAFGTYSGSIATENQVFAKVLAIHLAVGLAGCLAGIAALTWKNRRKKSG